MTVRTTSLTNAARACRISVAGVRWSRAPIVSALRYNSSATAGSSTGTSSKIDEIVNQISTLTLLETSELVGALKSRLNITEVAMPAGGGGGGAAAAPAAEEAAKPVEKEAEKTVFNLKLESFDAAAKAKVIREVKAALGLNLVDAKKFVEAAPKVLKEGVTKDDAEKIKKALEAAGAVVKLE
ncbi:54S ribosomal protein L12, mitochondrial [Savitreella phatthalungensis]